MSGFNMMGLMNEKSKKTGEKQKYEMRTINIGQIIENPANSKIYTTEDIGRLADSIELAGRVLQNLVVKPADENGKYMLISGHRRLKACNHLVSRGKLEFGSVQCLIENEEDEDLQELMLIYTNSTARDMNDAEKARQAERATAILTKMKQEKKLEGRVRDIAANMLKTTSGQLARYHAIMNNLKDEELQRAFNSGKIGVSVAYEASRLSEEGQHKIALQMRGGSVTLQDVTVKKMEERAANDPEWNERMERVKRRREGEEDEILREDFDCETDALNAAVRHVAGKNTQYAEALEWYTGDRVAVKKVEREENNEDLKKRGDKERTMRAAACIIGFLQKKIEEVQEELDDAKRMENEEGEANYTEVIAQLELMIEGKKIELENIM